MSFESEPPARRLRASMARKDRVLAVLHPPSAAHARVMEAAGCEAGFVGTGSVVGAYTGMEDVGAADMMECVQIGGWIANSVRFPVILDGDTGHGGIMAVRRLVRECIKAGLSGVRIDDQPIEGKRRTGSAGLEVIPLEHAIARYRAAVEMRDELDPDFVVMAQCYARDASGGGLNDAIRRMSAYETEGRADWVQLAAPHGVDEIKVARDALKGPFSFMKGRMSDFLTFRQHLELGVNLAWLPGFAHHVTWAALFDFMQAFNEKDVTAWTEFQAAREGRPYPIPSVGPEGEGLEKQRELEERYFGDLASKYKDTTDGQGSGPR